MEITSDTTRIRLAAFQLEGEALVWWRWVKTSRDLEVMTWAEFQELFMGKYFPETDESCRSGGVDGMLPLSAAWTHEEGLPPETGIPVFWDSTVPISSRIGEDTVRSSTA